jgi:hypothetical protein
VAPPTDPTMTATVMIIIGATRTILHIVPLETYIISVVMTETLGLPTISEVLPDIMPTLVPMLPIHTHLALIPIGALIRTAQPVLVMEVLIFATNPLLVSTSTKVEVIGLDLALGLPHPVSHTILARAMVITPLQSIATTSATETTMAHHCAPNTTTSGVVRVVVFGVVVVQD